MGSGDTIIAGASVTYRGLLSNVTNTAGPAAGVTMKQASVTVATPTLVAASSLGSRYVVGGSTISSVGTYNITSTNGQATINDLAFTVAGTGVQSLTINNVTSSVIGGVANFYGINLAVPAGTAGVNIPVSVVYSPVTVSGQGGVASGATSTISLTNVKYTAGGVVTTMSPAPNVASNQMTSAASVLSLHNQNTSSSYGPGTYAQQKVGTITVTADVAGNVSIGKMDVNIPYGNGSPVFKINGSAMNGCTYTGTSTVSLTCTNGYTISAGQAVNIDVYSDINNTSSGSSNISISLGSPANLKWSDIVDGLLTSGTMTKTGTLLQGYNN